MSREMNAPVVSSKRLDSRACGCPESATYLAFEVDARPRVFYLAPMPSPCKERSLHGAFRVWSSSSFKFGGLG